MSTLFTQTPPLTKYWVAAIQYNPTLGEKEKNILDLLRLVEEAAAHQARLIVLPEMVTTGYCWLSSTEIAPYTEPIPGPTTARFQQVASKYNCFIALGLPEIDPLTQIYYNSMVLLGPDGVVGTYRKLHSDIGEPRWARDGDLGVPVWDTPLGRISGLISIDAKYFEAARLAALHEADVLLLPSNWVEDSSPSSWWMARAFENKLYMVVANRYGKERGLLFRGGSCVLNPDGSLQAYREGGEGIVYGEVDLQLCRDKSWQQENEVIGYPLADRQPSAYREVVQNSYLWEPLRYHSAYELGELPAGQLSCAGIVQLDLHEYADLSQQGHSECIQALQNLLQTWMRDNSPAIPDVLVLPELLLPGPLPVQTQVVDNISQSALVAHYRNGAIQVPGPETNALVTLASDLQVSLVCGVAERVGNEYYNTVLLIDPEGVYGIYRKVHLSQIDRLWACPGNLGFPIFDTPSGRIGLATGYDVLFPETLRVLASKGADLVCAPTFLNFPSPVGFFSTSNTQLLPGNEPGLNPWHFLLWRIRAAEHNVYLVLANWSGIYQGMKANGLSGIYSPGGAIYGLSEVIADEDEGGLMMMTIDTREQRTGRRTTNVLSYSPGDMVGSLTGELAYNVLDSIPGNVVRSKPMLRKRQPFWYMDLVRSL
jgi:predicted amidohydrolase